VAEEAPIVVVEFELIWPGMAPPGGPLADRSVQVNSDTLEALGLTFEAWALIDPACKMVEAARPLGTAVATATVVVEAS
jgi:hypothetical protein